jgi:hypothetical protein
MGYALIGVRIHSFIHSFRMWGKGEIDWGDKDSASYECSNFGERTYVCSFFANNICIDTHFPLQ